MACSKEEITTVPFSPLLFILTTIMRVSLVGRRKPSYIDEGGRRRKENAVEIKRRR
jgi:hypothetical protein